MPSYGIELTGILNLLNDKIIFNKASLIYTNKHVQIYNIICYNMNVINIFGGIVYERLL